MTSRIPTLVFISGGLFGAILLAVFAGDAIIASGVVSNPTVFETPAKIVFFTLFVAFGFSLIPLMVALVLGGLELIGRGLKVQPFQPLISHPGWVVWPIWALMALGLALALPAAIRAGFFGHDEAAPAAKAERTSAEAIARLPGQGTLVAAPGMPVASMIASSSLKVRRGSTSELFSGAQYGGAAIFNYRIAGTATIFSRCRYYYVTTYARNPARIATINVGISSKKLSHTALDAADRNIRERLIADGWKRFGPLWVRSGIALDLHSRRLDHPTAGEKPAKAGAWIQYVELREQQPPSKVSRLKASLATPYK
ncbi:MAG TPA: hypothetical protein VHR97_12655 [Candidatus Baltobacteraceae bacterium]|jgi:hypothetical protein|nr:hypothetical protein [Candidatus Baltobacteraceae bacterium]